MSNKIQNQNLTEKAFVNKGTQNTMKIWLHYIKVYLLHCNYTFKYWIILCSLTT